MTAPGSGPAGQRNETPCIVQNPLYGPRGFHGNLEEGIVMSRVERVEGEVQNLSAEELKDFRDWFARFDAAAWDQQIEADADNGKLRSLAERALKDHEAGRSTLL
jgi:hypothetical protein